MVTACASVEEIGSTGVFFFLQELELPTEEEATLFREISSGPLDCQDVQDSEGPSSLSSACEGYGGIQMFLSLTSGSWSTHGCQL